MTEFDDDDDPLLGAAARTPHAKPGVKKFANTPEERATPRCEKCSHLRINEDKSAVCGHWKPLEPVGCEEFDDVSRERPFLAGGITKVKSKW